MVVSMSQSFTRTLFKTFGTGSLSYASFQDQCRFFTYCGGAIAYFSHSGMNEVKVLGDPLADPLDWVSLVTEFLNVFPDASFYYVSPRFAVTLRSLSFIVTPFGLENMMDVSRFSVSWSQTGYLKRQLSKSRLLDIHETSVSELDVDDLTQLDRHWRQKFVYIKDPYCFLVRPLPFCDAADVRVFAAFDQGELVGVRFFDPMYKQGAIYGYYASISRYDWTLPYSVSTAILFKALSVFKTEGVDYLSLGLSPFSGLSLVKGDPSLSCIFLLLYAFSFPFSFKELARYKRHFPCQCSTRYVAFRQRFPLVPLWETWQFMRGKVGA